MACAAILAQANANNVNHPLIDVFQAVDFVPLLHGSGLEFLFSCLSSFPKIYFFVCWCARSRVSFFYGVCMPCMHLMHGLY